MEENKGSGRKIATEMLACSGCGGSMEFDPETQLLKCTRCGLKIDFIKSDEVHELDLSAALENNAKWKEEALYFRCEACGARVSVGRAETAGHCPFCGASHVIAEEDMQGLRPNGIIPFAFGPAEATAKFKAFAKKKFFAPNGFKKSVTADRVCGVYMPYFTFDSYTVSEYSGRVGDEHTRTVQTKDGTRTETYVTWRYVSGTYDRFFDDLTIFAGSDADAAKLGSLGGHVSANVKTYDTEYLHGFVARRYEKTLDSAWGEAKRDMDRSIKSEIIAQQHCDRVDYINISTTHHSVTYKYLLIPVYVINFRHHKKSYVNYMSGMTGRIIGKTPVSAAKVTLFSLGIAAAVALIAAVIYFLLN